MLRHVDHPWCETCGEQPQAVRLADAGLCEDCFGPAFRETLGEFFWSEPCGRPLFNADGTLRAVCVEPHGTEHDHST